MNSPIRVALTALLAAAIVIACCAASASAFVTVGGTTYYTTEDLCHLSVSPTDVTLDQGQTQTFTATVTRTGPDFFEVLEGEEPPNETPTPLLEADAERTFQACVFNHLEFLSNVIVRFTVVSGPDAGLTKDVPLDATGTTATFDVTSNGAGTDVVQAQLILKNLCEVFFAYEEEPPYWSGEISEEPIPQLPEICTEQQSQVGSEGESGATAQSFAAAGPSVNAAPLTVTLAATASVNWRATSSVAATADPTLSITAFKRCVSRTFRIAPRYEGGTIVKSVLFIDGRKVRTHTGHGFPFAINPNHYSRRKHNFEIVTLFADGRSASKFGSFTRCQARSSQRRISPNFTG